MLTNPPAPVIITIGSPSEIAAGLVALGSVAFGITGIITIFVGFAAYEGAKSKLQTAL